MFSVFFSFSGSVQSCTLFFLCYCVFWLFHFLSYSFIDIYTFVVFSSLVLENLENVLEDMYAGLSTQLQLLTMQNQNQ